MDAAYDRRSQPTPPLAGRRDTEGSYCVQKDLIRVDQAWFIGRRQRASLQTPIRLINRDYPVGALEVPNQRDMTGLRVLDFGHLSCDILYGRGGDQVARANPVVHQDQVSIIVDESELVPPSSNFFSF